MESGDSKCHNHLAFGNDVFVFGLIVDGREAYNERLFDDRSFWSREEIPILKLLQFEALSMFKVHPSKRSLWDGALKVCQDLPIHCCR